MYQPTNITIVSPNSCFDWTFKTADFNTSVPMIVERKSIVAAGKGVNVARTLGLLGCDCQIVGLVGAADVDCFTERFNQLPVHCNFIPAFKTTRINFTIVSDQAQGELHFRETGSNISAFAWNKLCETLLQSEVTEQDQWVIFCGSLPPGWELDKYASLLTELKQRKVKIGVDHEGYALRVALESGVDLIKPNRLELSTVVDLDAQSSQEQSETAMLQLLDQTRQRYNKNHNLTILASDGENGVYLSTATQIWHARLDAKVKVAINSTVGAGDATLAGFLSKWVSDSENNDPLSKQRIITALTRTIQTATARLASNAAGEINPKWLGVDVAIREI